jgi:hypothetical protein
MAGFKIDLLPKIPPDIRDRLLPPLRKGELDPIPNQDFVFDRNVHLMRIHILKIIGHVSQIE